jgi:hypothetical protein
VKCLALLVLASISCGLSAKLPASTEAEKAVVSRNVARQAWNTKQDAFESCRAQDRVVKQYQDSLRSQGKAVPSSVITGDCADPGPYVADSGTPIVNRPIEASGAHSPPGTAVTPPSTKIPQSELQIKK